MSNDRKLVEDFAASAATLTAAALNKINPVKRELLADALASGGGKLCLVVTFDPLCIVGAIHSTVEDIDPLTLFKIEGDPFSGDDPLSGETH